MLWWIVGFIALLIGIVIVNILISSTTEEAKLGRAFQGAEDENERQQLLKRLIELNSDAALFHIANLGLSDKSEPIRGLAIDALLEAGPRSTLPLISSLNAPGRLKSCYILGQIADRMAIPALQKVTARSGEDPRVKDRAMGAIQRILEVNGDGDIYKNNR